MQITAVGPPILQPNQGEMFSLHEVAAEAFTPCRSSARAAGVDLFAPHTTHIFAGEKVRCDTLIRAVFPPHHFGYLCLRSSAALTHRMAVHGQIIVEHCI